MYVCMYPIYLHSNYAVYSNFFALRVISSIPFCRWYGTLINDYITVIRMFIGFV